MFEIYIFSHQNLHNRLKNVLIIKSYNRLILNVHLNTTFIAFKKPEHVRVPSSSRNDAHHTKTKLTCRQSVNK